MGFTFTAGVVPGGLTANSEIKILICHVLCKIGLPISHEDLLSAVSDQGYANYFESADAVSDLLNMHHIEQDQDGNYTITESGKQIASLLSDDVALSVRERVVSRALNLARRFQRSNSNKVEIIKLTSGYKVRCTVSDKDGEIFALELLVPSQKDAQRIRDNFVDKAEDIIRQNYVSLMDENI